MPKLKIGKPSDRFEQQADRVADSVMRMPNHQAEHQSVEKEEGTVQMKSGEKEEELQMQTKSEEEEELQMQQIEAEEEEEETLQMKCERCEEEEKMRMAPAIQMNDNGTAFASAEMGDQIKSSKSHGRPLSSDTQQEMSTKMGADFRDVQVHTDSRAVQMNRALRAKAFTVGNNIYFNAGQYAPQSNQGKHLLAHELAHTLQQGGDKRIQRAPALGAAAPAAANWQVVPNSHQDRVNAALDLVGTVVNNRRCQTYFEDNCTDGRGANSLQHAYDNAVVFNLNTNDSTYGSSLNNTNDIAYNNTAYNTGRWFLASTLLHEMFHTCDPAIDAQDEIDAENAVEACRLYTPILSSVSPAIASVGDTVTLRGISFGASQGNNDKVYFNNLDAGAATSWGYAGAAGSSQGQIDIKVPAGATSGTIKVVNNGIASNEKPFTVNAAP
ncbi:eCIS core domain-containing protein [Rhodohalobacter sp. 8-1]|uniref:eCIS core domain-containing protein n=1 Tax=Rhodohalobacter sp. 8-1 TaxID=3131972 RepID=UPI0030EBD636